MICLLLWVCVEFEPVAVLEHRLCHASSLSETKNIKVFSILIQLIIYSEHCSEDKKILNLSCVNFHRDYYCDLEYRC